MTKYRWEIIPDDDAPDVAALDAQRRQRDADTAAHRDAQRRQRDADTLERRATAQALHDAAADAERIERQRVADEIARITDATTGATYLWHATFDVTDHHRRIELFELLTATKAAYLEQ